MSRTVCMLISIPNEESFNNCTLSLKSIRVAFPNDKIEVSLGRCSLEQQEAVYEMCKKVNSSFTRYDFNYHHAEFIKDKIGAHDNQNNELIIVDPDMVFHKEWEFTYNTILAGAYVPLLWNEWTQCISYPRLHTSFLCVKDCEQLRKAIDSYYPTKDGWVLTDPYYPRVMSGMGRKLFWDTCAGLLDVTPATYFGEKEYDQFDHVNSSSFVTEMGIRMEHGKEFLQHHERISRNPELLVGFWRESEAYYLRMHQKAMNILAQS